MKARLKLLFLIWFVFFVSTTECLAQKNTVKFGINIEPIIPNNMFRIRTEDIKKDNINFSITPKNGYLFGGSLSMHISNKFTIESGISMIQRHITINATDELLTTSLNYKIHNFEIPLTSTFFVRLSESIFMGHTAGFSFQMLPSHLTSKTQWVENNGFINNFEQLSIRKSWIVPTFKGGIGFEYRTQEEGHFYFGAVYHLFTNMYETRIIYKTSAKNEIFFVNPQSDFFGILLRYCFHPSPLLLNKKKTK